MASILQRELAEIDIKRAEFFSARIAELIADDYPEGDAQAAAEEEWGPHLLAMAPECGECAAGKMVHDPYGTGDSPDMIDCKVACPWRND